MGGPTTPPNVPTVKFKVFAAGTSSAGTIRGMMAPRADDATANSPDCTNTSPRISQTLRRSASVCSSRTSVTSQVPTEDHR